jgi:hypothetical protein
VHASLANKSPLTLHLLNPLGGTDSYPNQPMSLIVQTDNGSGRKQLQPLVATQFAPTLPQVLKPHSTWTGTFAGSDPVAHDTAFYVGFGRFAYAGSFDEQSFSTSTAKSAQAP